MESSKAIESLCNRSDQAGVIVGPYNLRLWRNRQSILGAFERHTYHDVKGVWRFFMRVCQCPQNL